MRLPYGHYSYTRESPTLPPNDVEAASSLDVAAFTVPSIRPISMLGSGTSLVEAYMYVHEH
jgi:hypothetical protein